MPSAEDRDKARDALMREIFGEDYKPENIDVPPPTDAIDALLEQASMKEPMTKQEQNKYLKVMKKAWQELKGKK